MNTSLIEKFCRTCFQFCTPGETFVSIKAATSDGSTYISKLQTIVPELVIDKADPCSLCQLCTERVELCYMFRKMCIETEAKFVHFKDLQSYTDVNRQMSEDLNDLLNDLGDDEEDVAHGSHHSSRLAAKPAQKQPARSPPKLVPKSPSKSTEKPKAKRRSSSAANEQDNLLDCTVMLERIDVPVSNEKNGEEAAKNKNKKRLFKDKPYINKYNRYQCRLCAYTISNLGTFYEHLRKHKRGIPYECNLCKKPFLSHVNLGVHMRAIHSIDISDVNRSESNHLYTINMIKPRNASTVKKKIMKRAKRKDSSDDDSLLTPTKNGFYCGICRKEFRTKEHINVHMKTKPFPCHKCNMRFSRTASRTRHLRLYCVHRVKNEQSRNDTDTDTDLEETSAASSMFTCQICHESIVGKNALVEHMGVHVIQTHTTVSDSTLMLQTKVNLSDVEDDPSTT